MKSVTQVIALSTLALLQVQLAPAYAERYAHDREKPGYQEPNTQPGKSRAQVLEELAQARSSGELDIPDNAYPRIAPVASNRTRNAVRQEALSASNRFNSDLYRNQ